jgi:hypothetical protein
MNLSLAVLSIREEQTFKFLLHKISNYSFSSSLFAYFISNTKYKALWTQKRAGGFA